MLTEGNEENEVFTADFADSTDLSENSYQESLGKVLPSLINGRSEEAWNHARGVARILEVFRVSRRD